MLFILALLSCTLTAGLYILYTRLQARDATIRELQRKNTALGSRFRSLTEMEAVHQRLSRENQALLHQQNTLRDTLRQLGNTIVAVQADLEAHHQAARLEASGYARGRFELDIPEFQRRLQLVESRQKQLIVDGRATIASARWKVSGNEAEGERRQEQVLNLMLRAFNGECEAAIAKVRAYGADDAEKRIRRAFTTINLLVATQQCVLTEAYLHVQLEKLFLQEAYRRRIKTDKEAQRGAQARMREELQELKKLKDAQLKAEQEEQFYTDELRRATGRAEQLFGSERLRYNQQIEQLKQSLAKARELKSRATAQAQLTTKGHVYVISNVGSFGEHVYKIGMTRRLEPQERINELSNASVPFPFDVHAIIACDNAPMLEKRLHDLFQHRRVNLANTRKEFFRVSLQEIAAAVQANHGAISFVHEAEALEYRQTASMYTGKQ